MQCLIIIVKCRLSCTQLLTRSCSCSIVCSAAVWLPYSNWLWVHLLARNKA